MSKIKDKLMGNNFLMVITIALFFVMYIAGMIVYGSKGFNTLQNLFNLFITNAGLFVIASGMTMVLIVGGIDISVGSTVAVTCMMLSDMMTNKNLNPVVAILIVLVYGCIFGMVQGFLVSFLKIQPFIVSLAGMFFARGLTAVISLEMISISNPGFLKFAQFRLNLPFGGTVNKAGDYVAPYVYPTVVIALLIVVIMFIVLRYTKFGRSVYAVGGNEQSAMLMGLNVRRTKFLVYSLNGLLTVIGGILYCMNILSGTTITAQGYEMEAIAGAVIGGTPLTGGAGNVFGTVFGVLIKALIERFVSFQGNVSSWWAKIIIAALLAFFIILQSVLVMNKEKNLKS